MNTGYSLASRFRREQGFVLTIEFLLISTVLVIGVIVGVVAIRDSLVKQNFARLSRDMIIVDANSTVLGPVVAFDEHEAPLVPYIDRTQSPDANGVVINQRILIGIRDDRFTSREPIYYTGENCTGTPCIKSRSDEYADSTDIAGAPSAGAVSYSIAQQGYLNYGIGRSSQGVKGALFRETVNSCPASGADIRSRYLSQKVVAGTPCESISAGAAAETGGGTVVGEAYTECLIAVTAETQLIADSCACPAGYATQDSVLEASNQAIQDSISLGIDSLSGTVKKIDPPVEVGSVCCPTGSTLQSDSLADTVAFFALSNLLKNISAPGNQLDNSIQSLNEALIPAPLVCVSESESEPTTTENSFSPLINLKVAEPVPAPQDAAQNALERFVAPFRLNEPGEATSKQEWYSTRPDGEG